MVFSFTTAVAGFSILGFSRYIFKYAHMHIMNAQLCQQLYTPQNTIITFDIHGVLFEFDKQKIKHILKKDAHVFKILLYLLWPPFTKDLIHFLRYKMNFEEFLFFLDKYKGLNRVKSTAIKIINSQKPNVSTTRLITELKDKGYSLHIFSNIGSTMFEQLKEQYPDLIKQFSYVQIPCIENNFIGKPHKQAYREYKSLLDSRNKNIVFIDDNKKNVRSALACKIYSIHFKNTQKLHAQLQEIKVLQKPLH